MHLDQRSDARMISSHGSGYRIHSILGSRTPRLLYTHPRFEVFLQVTTGRVERLVLSLQTTHHEAAFERADHQRGQFRGIDLRPYLAASFSFLGDRLQATNPGTQSLPSF